MPNFWLHGYSGIQVFSSFWLMERETPSLVIQSETECSEGSRVHTLAPLLRGAGGVLEYIELCILRFAHDTPIAPLKRGISGCPHGERNGVAYTGTNGGAF